MEQVDGQTVKQPIIGITMGDPAGIGPELCLRTLNEPAILRQCVPVVFGDSDVLGRVAAACGLRLPAGTISISARQSPGLGNALQTPDGPIVVDCSAVDSRSVRPGEIQEQCGRAAYRYIQSAVNAAMAGHVSAIATAPVHKESLQLAGVEYPGHTEMLAALTGARCVCMMLASEELTVGLVTTHVSYAEVPALLTPVRILDVIKLTTEAMTRLGKRAPRIAVCGLNPHGGEHGLFGREDQDLIEPAIAEARSAGLSIEGPLPPDTAFLPDKRREIDAYVVMYHDQGLIPFKMIAFDRGVNITLGLPIVRTSAVHGTAFDIAWKGTASAASLIESVLWAVKLSGPFSRIR